MVDLGKDLADIVGARWVKTDHITRFTYQTDALPLFPKIPLAIVLPQNKNQVAAVVKYLHDNHIFFLARGAGTGLSGGAIPVEESVIIDMARMDRILEWDEINRTIDVEPGVVNIHISKYLAAHGYYFVPDPSSQNACTVGGNVAENSGGPHTLKYGVTLNHVLALEVILPDGTEITLGTDTWGLPGPDLLGLFIGSEGTFGIVTKIKCRITPLPQSVRTLLCAFSNIDDACRAVSEIIAAGIIPAALELIDALVIQAVEQTIQPGFPLDAAAVLLIELEELEGAIDAELSQVKLIAEENHACMMRLATEEKERSLLWKARKEAFGALGKISPAYYTQDGVIPRSKLPEVLRQIMQQASIYGLRIANVFHAGDGNLHPLILYDSQNPQQIEKAWKLGEEILEICLKFGGALSGEHGIGLEKTFLMDKAFSPATLNEMKAVRTFFNRHGLLNPHKVIPTPGMCSEINFTKHKTGIGV
jgi:glycolate oxidase